MFDRFKSLLSGAPKGGSTTTPGPNEFVPDQSRPDLGNRRAKAHHKRPATFVRTATGVRFSVDDVVPASDPLWLGTLRESAEIRADATVLVMPDAETPATAPEGYGEKLVKGEPRKPARVSEGAIRARSHFPTPPLSKSRTFLHPLVQAVHLAFSDHRPLVLTPDSIWLTIVQGFAQHVQQNSEELRKRLVRHEGKLELVLRTDSLNAESWPALISQFSELIRENSDPVLHETLVCTFSTTTPTIKTALEICLMDTYQRYFDYGVHCVCGIPEVTVEGSAEDWQRMRDRIEVLATYDLHWWTSRVAPILDQFVATAKGDPDVEFWQAIYKPQTRYAARLASGWIIDLFPYLYGVPRRSSDRLSMDAPGRGLCDSPSCNRNSLLNEPRTNWLLPSPSDHPFAGRGVSLDNFPSGLSRAPVTLQFPDRSKMSVEVMGGFLGVSQCPDDNALSPVIHWAVVQKAS